MKTTFYKKLVPLAMIASLALSGAGSAIAGTGFLTYNDNSIVAFADEVATPAVDLNFVTATTNATKTAEGKFDYFDADDKVRATDIVFSIQENYTRYDCKNYTGVTISGTGNQTVYEYKKDSETVYLTKSGGNWYKCEKTDEENVYSCEYDNIITDEELKTYTEVPDEGHKDVRPLADEKVSAIKVSDFTIKKSGETTAADDIKLAGIAHEMVDDTDAEVVEGEKTPQKPNGNNFVLTFDVAGKANGTYELYYGNENVSTITYSKTTTGIETTIATGVLESYTGDAKNIDLTTSTLPTVTEIKADAFKDRTGIQNVVLSASITKIGAGAFSGCTALDTVTVPATSTLSSVAADAFPANTVVILEKNSSGKVSEDAKTAFANTNANVFDESSVEVEGQMILSAGDEIKFNCVNNTIVSGTNNAKLTFNNGYTFGTPGEGEKKVPADYKWVLATTAGKGSSAAKIKVGKKTYGQYKNITKFDISGTKANGKFNNTVVLMAVPNTQTKDYDANKAYAYCKLYIKPAVVTDWKKVSNVSKSGMSFVADKEDDHTKSPVQNDAKEWIKTPSKADGCNVVAGKEYAFTTWEGVLEFSKTSDCTKTTVQEEAWKLDDGTLVVVPATKENGDVKYETVDSKTNFTLTLAEGQSFALPNKAADGADKTLKYEVAGDSNSSFTVVNGKVKGISQGTGTITIKPVDEKSTVTPITVNVVVNAKVAKGLTNTTALTLVGTKAQKFRIGANPISAKKLYYTISADEALNVTAPGTTVASTGENPVTYYELTNGAAEITVSQKMTDGEGIGTAKKPISIQYYELEVDGTTVTKETKVGKEFKVNVSESKTGEYDNVKKFKESAGKLDKVTKFRKLSVPVGVTTYLGLSVTPATADQNFTVTCNDADCAIVGDAVTPTAEGTYYVTATSAGIGADGEQVESATYEITAYKQAGSIVWKATDYSVVGGFLMDADNVKTSSDYTFVPGANVSFAAPTNDAEDITWTSNNPAGLWVNVVDGTMSVNCLQPGTYTVTGKSAKTAQKYTFKVLVDKKNTVKATNADLEELADGALSGLEKGNTVQLGVKVPVGVAGTVKWTTDNKAVATVSGKGLVKIVNKENKADTCKITATITLNDENGKKPKEATTLTKEFTIGTKASTVTVTPKTVPAAVKVDTPFKVAATVKNAKADEIKWTAEKEDGTTTNLTPDKGKVTIATAGTYDIYAAYGTDTPQYAGTIVVSTTPISKLAVVDGAPGSALSVKDLKNKKVGLQNKNAKTVDGVAPVTSATVYVKATTDKTGTPADLGEIVWTSSNANAVKVTGSVAPTATSETSNDQYAKVTVTVQDTTYVGKVTLTGVSKNSGKKVSFVVMVNDGATAEAQGVPDAATE